jgi:hypothetical protein
LGSAFKDIGAKTIKKSHPGTGWLFLYENQAARVRSFRFRRPDAVMVPQAPSSAPCVSSSASRR